MFIKFIIMPILVFVNNNYANRVIITLFLKRQNVIRIEDYFLFH